MTDNNSNNLIHTVVVGGNNKVINLALNKIEEKLPTYAFNQLINAKNFDGATPLMLAARYGNLAAVEMLIQKGANINDTNEEGWTALHCAAHWGHYETFEFLWNRKAKITVMAKNNHTILHSAAFGGNSQIIKLILRE